MELDMQSYANTYVDYSGFRMETTSSLVLFFNRNSVLMSHELGREKYFELNGYVLFNSALQ